MPAITCYGSAGEIGGNKILLEDGDSRLLFDYGIAFSRMQAYFNDFLRPRSARGLLDLLALELIPPLEGLYREDLVLPGLWDRFRAHPLYRNVRRDGGTGVDGLLLSHAHLDHNGDISYLDPAIPIYSTRASAFIARAMQVTGMNTFEREMVWANPRILSAGGNLETGRAPYLTRPYAFLDGPLSAAGEARWTQSPAASKPLLVQQHTGSPCQVGELPVLWGPVDHSLPGACGFAVHASAGWIAYTGDIRYHGKSGAATARFARDLARLSPIALLCEGTHCSSKACLAEQDIISNAIPLVRAHAGQLILADFGPRNVERLLAFLTVAQETGRRLAVQSKDCYLLECIQLADPSACPDPLSLADVVLYADPRVSPRPWEGQTRSEWSAAGRTVAAVDVSRTPGEYILCFSLWDANDLLDLECDCGGAYLYSNSRAYDDEQAADLERLRNWAHHMRLTVYGDPDDSQAVPLHASGHASGPELVQFVTTVRPEILIPIHTENPRWWEEQLAGSGISVCLPELGSTIEL